VGCLLCRKNSRVGASKRQSNPGQHNQKPAATIRPRQQQTKFAKQAPKAHQGQMPLCPEDTMERRVTERLQINTDPCMSTDHSLKVDIYDLENPDLLSVPSYFIVVSKTFIYIYICLAFLFCYCLFSSELADQILIYFLRPPT
jgi:hypothetical protein